MNTETPDFCVLCGKETPYTLDIHVDFRKGYIEGAGQLCESCYESHYNVNKATEGQVVVPIDLIYNTPNNTDLGEKVRDMYWKITNRKI